MASVQKRPGRKSLYVVYWMNGKQRWRSTGSDDWDYARRMADEIEATRDGSEKRERAQAILDEAGLPKITAEGRVKMSRLWKEYEKYETKEMAERTRSSKKKILMRWVEWMEQRYPDTVYAGEVTRRQAWEYMNTVFREAAAVTWNNNLSALRSVFHILQVPAGLQENVWEAVPRRQGRSVRRKALSPDQVRRLLKHARDMDADGEFRERGFWPLAIMIAWHTGLRHGDVLTLEGRELDFRRDCFVLVPSKRKASGLEITPWFHPDFREKLFERYEQYGDGFLFPLMEKAHRRQHGWIFREWREIVGKEGLSSSRASGKSKHGSVAEYSFHSLRHGYVTAAAAAGVDVRDIQVTVGHATPAMTEHYNHSRAAWERLAESRMSLDEDQEEAEEKRGRG